MTLNGVMAVTLRYFSEFGKPALQKTICEFMQESIVFLVRVQCRRKESSRSLSHLMMSFLYGFIFVLTREVFVCLYFFCVSDACFILFLVFI